VATPLALGGRILAESTLRARFAVNAAITLKLTRKDKWVVISIILDFGYLIHHVEQNRDFLSPYIIMIILEMLNRACKARPKSWIF